MMLSLSLPFRHSRCRGLGPFTSSGDLDGVGTSEGSFPVVRLDWYRKDSFEVERLHDLWKEFGSRHGLRPHHSVLMLMLIPMIAKFTAINPAARRKLLIRLDGARSGY